MEKIGEIFIKNSSKDVNFGLHKIKVVIKTDAGRIYTDREYVTKFDVDYGDKKEFKTDLTLTVTDVKKKQTSLQ